MSRHRFDPFSFIAGAVAVGVAVTVLLGQVTVSIVDLRLAGPLLVLALGVALLLSGGRDRSGDGVPTDETAGVAPDTDRHEAGPDEQDPHAPGR